MVTTLLARRAQVHQVVLSQHTARFDPSLQNQVKALSLRLVPSGAIAASIMFLLSFIVRKNDPKAGGRVAVG